MKQDGNYEDAARRIEKHTCLGVESQADTMLRSEKPLIFKGFYFLIKQTAKVYKDPNRKARALVRINSI